MKYNNKINKGWLILFSILSLIIGINNIYLIINIIGLHSIENTLRLIGCIILTLLTLLNIFINIKILNKKKNWLNILMTIINILSIAIIIFININFNVIYKKLNKVSSSYTTYSISLVTTSENTVSDIKGINDEKIAIINDHEIANGYTFGEEVLKENRMNNELVEFDSYIEILNQLLEGKMLYAFLPSNYVEAFQTIEGYEKIGTTLKTIYEKNKQEEQLISTKDVTEPFTILLMGVDSTNENIANTTANGDSLMLITFNPNTLRATMVSIPRDSYVPITCMGNKKNKITHSSWGGEKCIINTVQNFTGVKIDYYAKINFTGIVKLVDALGGIDVDVEYSFCEQNSKRQWGYNTVYVKKGFQTIDGEQALAYARNRHPNPEMCGKEWADYNSNDFIRGLHQQDIVKAIMSKIKDIRSLDTFYNLLDTISNNMETNMDKNTILSFYNVAKDIVTRSVNAKNINELINIQRLYISGRDANIYDYNQNTNNGSRLYLYNFVPAQGSVDAVVKAMKINLGLIERDKIYTFNYDISSPYEEKIIGQGIYSGTTVSLLPDFTGQSKTYVENYAKEHNLGTPKFIEIESSEKAGTVISQDPPARMDLDAINPNKGLTITVSSGNKTSETNIYAVCKDSENSNNPICQLNIADYIGKNYTSLKKLKDIIKITEITVTEDATSTNAGNIKSLNGLESGTIDLTTTKEIKIEYYLYVKEDTPKDDENNSNSSLNPDNSNDNDNTDDNQDTENPNEELDN